MEKQMPTTAADAGIEHRIDVEISAGKDRMAAWLYSSAKYTPSSPGPALVLAHGLGATKELKLDVYASKFHALGYTCLVFDYRCNGGSTGTPCGLIDWNAQQSDWHTALAYVRAQENVDPERDRRLKVVISQCPFTDGWASARCTGLVVMPRIFALGILDRLFGSNVRPIRVPLVGAPGDTALMNAPDVLSGFYPLMPLSVHEHYFTNQKVPARLVPGFPFNRPGSHAKDIQCPVLFAVCGKDSVAPARPTLKYAKRAPKGIVKLYEDMGHFDIYLGEKHERAWKEYEAFVKEHLPA